MPVMVGDYNNSWKTDFTDFFLIKNRSLIDTSITACPQAGRLIVWFEVVKLHVQAVELHPLQYTFS